MSTSDGTQRRVLRIQFGIQMRRLRERADIPSKAAAKALGSDPSRLSRLEKGAATIKSAEVDLLLKMYDATADETENLRALGAEARRRGHAMNVPAWAETYIALEAIADEIKIYDGEVVPGFLQTEDYARALISTSEVTVPAEQVDEVVATRLGRHQRLTTSAPLKLYVILGEAVLHRPVGGAKVLRGQLERLRELVDLPNVWIQFIPYDLGEHAALGTSFTMFRLVDPAAVFVYVEWLTDSTYMHQRKDIEQYESVCNRLLASGTNKPTSRRMLDKRIRELS